MAAGSAKGEVVFLDADQEVESAESAALCMSTAVLSGCNGPRLGAPGSALAPGAGMTAALHGHDGGAVTGGDRARGRVVSERVVAPVLWLDEERAGGDAAS